MTSFASLQKQFGLPTDIAEYFPVEDLDEDTSLQELCSLIQDKISDASKMLEGVVLPDSNLTHMTESNNVSDKKAAFELFKKVMFIQRDVEKALLEHNEQIYLKSISHALSSWKILRPQVIKILEQMRDAWSLVTIYEDDEKYFG